jgi:hypothetical protein
MISTTMPSGKIRAKTATSTNSYGGRGLRVDTVQVLYRWDPPETLEIEVF